MNIAAVIDEAWDARGIAGASTTGAVRKAVEQALGDLDAGRVRVAEKVSGEWRVHQWLKKAVLLSFRLNGMQMMTGLGGHAWDKAALKFASWSEDQFRAAGFRAVPGAVVRHSAFIAKGRRADALLRQCRRACGREHNGRYLVDGGLVRADRRQLSSLRRRWDRRRAGTGAGGSHHH